MVRVRTNSGIESRISLYNDFHFIFFYFVLLQIKCLPFNTLAGCWNGGRGMERVDL